MVFYLLFVAEVKWCNYKPAKVVENGRFHIFWDFNIQRDYAIQHRRSDIFLLYKTERKCHLIDIAVPGEKDWVERTGEVR